MARVYHEEDADLVHLKGKKIAVIGYGSQGHAHALNLRDSGMNVVVGLYKGSKSWEKASREGLAVSPVEEAAAQAQVIMMLVPDQTQRSLYEASIKGQLSSGKTMMLRALIESLILGHPPQNLQFMLADLKGGSGVRPFAGVPHVAQIITDLEEDQSLMGRFVDALDGEIARRKALCDLAGADDATEYNKLRAEADCDETIWSITAPIHRTKPVSRGPHDNRDKSHGLLGLASPQVPRRPCGGRGCPWLPLNGTRCTPSSSSGYAVDGNSPCSDRATSRPSL